MIIKDIHLQAKIIQTCLCKKRRSEILMLGNLKLRFYKTNKWIGNLAAVDRIKTLLLILSHIPCSIKSGQVRSDLELNIFFLHNKNVFKANKCIGSPAVLGSTCHLNANNLLLILYFFMLENLRKKN